MTEKRKWFDRHEPQGYPVPQPLLLQRSVSSEEAASFLAELESRRPLPRRELGLFGELAAIPPARRLSRNLKIVLNRLADRPIRDFMRDALLPHELTALTLLAAIERPWQEIGHALLNVYERHQLAEACRTMFELERRHG